MSVYCLPELPNRLLIEDYLKGKRSQKYLDSDNVHQYEKRLDQIRAMQQSAANHLIDYKHKWGVHGTQRLEYINIKLLSEFGKVLESGCGSFYCNITDKNISEGGI